MFSSFDEPRSGEYEYRIVEDESERERLIEEKEMLGMYLTGHPLKGYEKDFQYFNFNTSMIPSEKAEDDDDEDEDKEITIDYESAGLYDNMQIQMGGLISSVSFKRTKTGKDMAILEIEDMYDKCEVTAFGKLVSEARNVMIKDSLVKIWGKLNIKDGKLRIMVNEIAPWDLKERVSNTELKNADTEFHLDKLKDMTLYFKIDSYDEELMSEINRILSDNPGDMRVRFQYNNKLYDHKQKISDPISVKWELIKLLGSNNVKLD